jgi:tRNA-2-methylthio-N6-dimethylallyladenosine synthase
VKAERLARLQGALARQSQAFNAAMIGRCLPVLIEKPGRRAGQLSGRSPYLQPVHAPGPLTLIGRIVEIEIEAMGAGSLSGCLASAPAAADA